MFSCRQSKQVKRLVNEACIDAYSSVTKRDSNVTCDDRDTLQALFHDFIFACPLKYWARTKVPHAYFYNFKSPQPLDLSYIPGLKPLDNCATVACHTAEINYQFEVENVFNCSMLEESLVWNGHIECDADGQLLDSNQKAVETHMHRYWANFMRNQNPNENDKGNYPPEWQESIFWNEFGFDEGRLNIGEAKNWRKEILELEYQFKKPECVFWDELHDDYNVYIDVGRI